MNRKKTAFVITCMLIAGLGLYVTWTFQRMIDSPSSPDPGNMKVLRECYSSARHSLGIRNSKEDASADRIELSYISGDEMIRCFSFANYNISFVMKKYMPIAYTPPVEAYIIDIYGKASQGAPEVYAGSSQVDLYTYKMNDKYVSENRSEYHERLRGLVSVSPVSLSPKKAYVRTFRSNVDENVKWVTISPIPVYQYDAFKGGRWTSTFAIWHSKPITTVQLKKYRY